MQGYALNDKRIGEITRQINLVADAREAILEDKIRKLEATNKKLLDLVIEINDELRNSNWRGDLCEKLAQAIAELEGK